MTDQPPVRMDHDKALKAVARARAGEPYKHPGHIGSLTVFDLSAAEEAGFLCERTLSKTRNAYDLTGKGRARLRELNGGFGCDSCAYTGKLFTGRVLLVDECGGPGPEVEPCACWFQWEKGYLRRARALEAPGFFELRHGTSEAAIALSCIDYGVAIGSLPPPDYGFSATYSKHGFHARQDRQDATDALLSALEQWKRDGEKKKEG